MQVDKNIVWLIVDGRKLKREDFTHQHVSNIYHFGNIITEYDIIKFGYLRASVKKYKNSIQEMAISIINERFNNEILSYEPVLDVEFMMLQELDCIKIILGEKFIFFKGKKIGKIHEKV